MPSCRLRVNSVKACSLSVSTSLCWCGVPFGEHAWPFSTCRPTLLARRANATNTTAQHGYVHWCVRICLCACLCGVVDLFCPQPPSYLLSPVPPARTPTCPCWVAQCCESSPFGPLSVDALRQHNCYERRKKLRRRAQRKEGNVLATRNPVALQANILRSERWQGHRHHKLKAHALQTVVNERSSMTSAQTTPTPKQRPLRTSKRWRDPA